VLLRELPLHGEPGSAFRSWNISRHKHLRSALLLYYSSDGGGLVYLSRTDQDLNKRWVLCQLFC
jgi:hypothetical protein